MPAAIQELHAKNLDYPVLIGGRRDQTAPSATRALYPGGKDSEEPYEPGVSTARTPSRACR